MATAIKRQKVSFAKNGSSSRPLDAFTRVSKASSVTKTVINKNNYVDTIVTNQLEYSLDRKRKSGSIEEGSAEDQVPVALSPTIKDREIKPLPQRRSHVAQRIPQTPKRPLTNAESPVLIETPTKGARSLLDQLCFSSNSLARSALSHDTLNTSAIDHKSHATKLPTELFDLINLHAAFLTALSLHYAHNGTHAPADLRTLCPDVARTWGKRRVTVEDIRRTLGLMNASILRAGKDHRISRLSLSDYGLGKICVEIRTGPGKFGRLARPVNENLMNEIYVQAMKASWEEREMIDMNPIEFIERLSLEPITTCPSLIKMSPLLAKGQRRLEDMRAGMTARMDTTKDKISSAENAIGTQPTLLERLRAKQLQKSSMPPPISKAQISRKAALQRIDELVAVLTILSTSSSIGQQRVSFTMPTVLVKLRDSFKTPMSKEEGDACVRLLASEIAPKWATIVKMGKTEALVVNRDERPTVLEIKQRVQACYVNL